MTAPVTAPAMHASAIAATAPGSSTARPRPEVDGEAERGGGRDDRQRGADRGAQREREPDGERGHDQEAAADAQEARDEADGDPRERIAREPQRRAGVEVEAGSGSARSARRQIERAATTITSASAASSSSSGTAPPTIVPSAMPGSAATVNETTWRQQTRPWRAWPTAPASAPAPTTSSEPVVASGRSSPST